MTEEKLREQKLQNAERLFCERVSLRYKNHCKSHGIEPTPEGLLQYAFQKQIFRVKDVVRYLVKDLYPLAMYNSNGRRRAAVEELEDILPVTDRTIWNVLKKRDAK